MTDDNVMSDYETTIIEPIQTGDWIELKPGEYRVSAPVVSDQGKQGSSWGNSIANAAEYNYATAKQPAYPIQMVVDGLLTTIYQPAEPPKPPTPKQRITAPSVPLSVRRKELARKMRAKR